MQCTKKINPDEAVAYGAAIVAANATMEYEKKSQSKLKDITLMDVTPLPLGIELHNGKMSVLIAGNTTIPYQHSKVYHNEEDGQAEVEIKVYEGEHKMAADNRILGVFVLTDLPPRPRGKLDIAVRFSINVNGILDVSAEVRGEADTKTTISINKDKGLLSNDDINAMSKKVQDEQARRESTKARDGLEEYVNFLKKEVCKNTNNSVPSDCLDETLTWITAVRNAGTILPPAVFEEKKGELQDWWKVI